MYKPWSCHTAKWRPDDGMERWRPIEPGEGFMIQRSAFKTECSFTSKPNIGRVHDCPTFWCEHRTGPDLSQPETFRTRLSESRPARPQSGSLTSNTSCPDQRRSCLPGAMSMSGCEQAASHGIPAHCYNPLGRWEGDGTTILHRSLAPKAGWDVDKMKFPFFQ